MVIIKKLIESISILCLVILLSTLTTEASYMFYDGFEDEYIAQKDWTLWKGPNINPISEKDGVLNFDYPPSSVDGGLTYNKTIVGDFECRIYWNWQFDGYEGFSNEPGAQVGWNIESKISADYSYIYQFRGWNPSGVGDIYVSNGFYDNEWQHRYEPRTSPDDTSGYFAMKREGKDITTYISDQNLDSLSEWSILSKFNDAFDYPVILNIRGNTGDHTNYLHIEWDDFFLEADYLRSSNAIPEPTTMLLLGAGLVGLAGVRQTLIKNRPR